MNFPERQCLDYWCLPIVCIELGNLCSSDVQKIKKCQRLCQEGRTDVSMTQISTHTFENCFYSLAMFPQDYRVTGWYDTLNISNYNHKPHAITHKLGVVNNPIKVEISKIWLAMACPSVVPVSLNVSDANNMFIAWHHKNINIIKNRRSVCEST